MKKTKKSAFILSECKSPYIAQAIFILKDGVSSSESGVIADAERIVASYMSDLRPSLPKSSDKFPTAIIAIISALSAVAITAFTFMYILN